MRRVLNVLFLLCLAFPLLAQQPDNKRRGRYLRTEVRRRDVAETYEVKAVPAKGSFPQFVFKKILVLTIHEVKVYETVMETVTANDGSGITPVGSVNYVVIPGEYIEGDETQRVERKYDGVLKMELFTLNGKAYTTDENGIWTDESQTVLAAFDRMRTKNVEFRFSHKEYGEAALELSRNFIKREMPVLPGTEKAQPTDVLEALGMDFSQLKLCSDEGISVQATYNKTAKPGEVLALTVEVKNNGLRSVSNVIGRSFTSTPGLDGKMFYYGLLLPGQKRSFSRLVTMPQRKGPCYIRLAFWSICGPVNKAATDLCIEIE